MRWRLSPSALARYELCPQQFKLADLERRPREERPSGQLVVANAVHHALQLCFGLKPEERSPDVFERALRSIWCEHRTSESFSSRDEEAYWGRHALDLLRRFCERFDWHVVALARERWVSIRLANGIELYGKADRIEESESGLLVVSDYKTGKHAPDAVEWRRDRAAQVYLLGTQSLFQREVESVQLLHLPSGETLSFAPSPEEPGAVRQSLVRLTDTIAADQAFQPRPGAACRWCPVARHCPDADRVDPDDIRPVEDLPF